jgi:hypothetical protein
VAAHRARHRLGFLRHFCGVVDQESVVTHVNSQICNYQLPRQSLRTTSWLVRNASWKLEVGSWKLTRRVSAP